MYTAPSLNGTKGGVMLTKYIGSEKCLTPMVMYIADIIKIVLVLKTSKNLLVVKI